jgi:SAM-dependent methyltransferase
MTIPENPAEPVPALSSGAKQPVRDFPPVVPDLAVRGRYQQAWAGPGAQWVQLILEDLAALGPDARPTVLDIGCGQGLKGVTQWQALIALQASCMIGIEPDLQKQPDPAFGVFDQVHACPFEQAPLPVASIDLAYAVMVLEHVSRPQAFFDQLAAVLRPGGVFWGFTVDGRHYFAWLSWLMGKLRIKDRYLDRVRGTRGHSAARYESYPTLYRCNTPAALARLTAPTFTLQTWSLHRVGQLNGYVPWRLRRLSRLGRPATDARRAAWQCAGTACGTTGRHGYPAIHGNATGTPTKFWSGAQIQL